jgi:hypothetical protein
MGDYLLLARYDRCRFFSQRAIGFSLGTMMAKSLAIGVNEKVDQGKIGTLRHHRHEKVKEEKVKLGLG